MPNKNYRRGRRKEYSIIEKLRKQGFDICQRSSGSHSPIDVFAINKGTREILLIQSKPDDFSELDTSRLLNENNWLSGSFFVKFIVE